MDRLRALLLVLTAAPVLAVPSSTSAQQTTGSDRFPPDPDLRITAPVPFAPCYSPTKVHQGPEDRASIPSISITGGEPGARYTISSPVNPPGLTLNSSDQLNARFDENGNATLVGYLTDPYSVRKPPAPGREIDLTVITYRDGTDFPYGPVPVSRTPVGSITGTPTYGVKVGPGVAAGQTKSVVVSGVPFANRDVYLFLTDDRSGKQLSRVKLGRADKCGYLKGKAVLVPKRHKGPLPTVWVIASPKLDKSKALATQAGSSF